MHYYHYYYYCESIPFRVAARASEAKTSGSGEKLQATLERVRSVLDHFFVRIVPREKIRGNGKFLKVVFARVEENMRVVLILMYQHHFCERQRAKFSD